MPPGNKLRLTCFDVADYFLSQVNDDSGDFISNLKLQKLVYYAQGFHLACYDEPLFAERIEAWEHGPVVPDLYYKYREYGAEPIPIPYPTDIDFTKFDDDTREFLDEIYKMFGQYSAWKLREMAHGEPPWKEAYEKGTNNVITHESLKAYFIQFVEDNGD